MKNAMERLNELVMEKGPLLAGLDPDIEKVLAMYEQMDEGKKDEAGKPTEKDFEEYDDYLEAVMYDFCCDYIDAVKATVAAVKINVAFFEACSMEDLFFEVAKEAKAAGLFVIADAKRADIGNTSKQYAQAFLNADSPIDAVTINPYFGTDGVQPFLEMAKKNEKGVFVLVKTSNPSSSEIQDLELKDGNKVYHEVAEMVTRWGEYMRTTVDEGYNLVGAVVGATHPSDAEFLRKMMSYTFFLVPGYGAQGATAEDVAVNFDSSEGGAIVNSSRGLMFAYEKEPWKDEVSVEDWKVATKEAAEKAQGELLMAIWANKDNI